MEISTDGIPQVVLFERTSRLQVETENQGTAFRRVAQIFRRDAPSAPELFGTLIKGLARRLSHTTRELRERIIKTRVELFGGDRFEPTCIPIVQVDDRRYLFTYWFYTSGNGGVPMIVLNDRMGQIPIFNDSSRWPEPYFVATPAQALAFQHELQATRNAPLSPDAMPHLLKSKPGLAETGIQHQLIDACGGQLVTFVELAIYHYERALIEIGAAQDKTTRFHTALGWLPTLATIAHLTQMQQAELHTSFYEPLYTGSTGHVCYPGFGVIAFHDGRQFDTFIARDPNYTTLQRNWHTKPRHRSKRVADAGGKKKLVQVKSVEPFLW